MNKIFKKQGLCIQCKSLGKKGKFFESSEGENKINK